MASTVDFIEYVCEQILGVGEIRYRKMFGEYMVYINEKPILLVCDNTVYVKKLDCIADKMKNAETGFPYTGAKEHYILELDNADFCKEIILLLEPLTAIPKPKKKKKTEKSCNCCNAQNSIKSVDGEYICYCNKVTKNHIIDAVRVHGAKTVEEVIKITEAMQNSNCAVNNPKGTCCYSDIVQVFNDLQNPH